MASQSMNTMDLSFESYEGAPLGGCMLDDKFNIQFEHDVTDVIFEAGFSPANVNKSAPGSVIYKFETVAEQATQLLDQWGGPLQLFDGLDAPGADFDIESIVCASDNLPVRFKKELESVFDAFSTDPVDPLFSSLSEITSGQKHVSTCVSELDKSADDFQQVLKNVSAPGSPDSGIGIASSPQSCYSDESFVGSQESSVLSPVVNHEILNTYEDDPMLHVAPPVDTQTGLKTGNVNDFPQCMTLPTVSTEDLAFLESLWCDGELPVEGVTPAPTLGSESVLTAVVLKDTPAQTSVAPSKPIQSSYKPVKTKALTLSEKRERKRSQNKNAATRYREKKRSEAQVIYEDQTLLEEKNKGLTDKMTLISREIQYMKELLIEVYKAKGLIE